MSGIEYAKADTVVDMVNKHIIPMVRNRADTGPANEKPSRMALVAMLEVTAPALANYLDGLKSGVNPSGTSPIDVFEMLAHLYHYLSQITLIAADLSEDPEVVGELHLGVVEVYSELSRRHLEAMVEALAKRGSVQ